MNWLGMRNDTIDIVSVTTVTATGAPPLQMGYALMSRRATIAVDAHVGARLQELFELGNVNMGSWLTSEVHKHKRRRID